MDAIRSGSFGVCSSLVVALLVAAGCGNDVQTPAPRIEGEVGADDPGEAAVHPGFACNTQQSKWIQVRGKNFTPMVVDVLEDGEQQVRWPRVRITRVRDLEGNEVDEGRSVEIQTDGTRVEAGSDEDMQSTTMALDGGMVDADSGGSDLDGEVGIDVAGDTVGGEDGGGDVAADGTSDVRADATSDASTTDTGPSDPGDAGVEPTEDASGDTVADAVPPGARGDAGGSDGGLADADSGQGGEGRHLVWLDETRLRFKVTPEMELAPGLYDVTVLASRVPEGRRAREATRQRALGILPRPAIEQVEQKPVCLDGAERTLSISGRHFLRDDEREPSIRIGGESYSPESISGESCETPGEPFAGYETCSEMSVTVPADALGPGSYEVRVENFDPAACHSRPERDESTFRVVPPPAVRSVEPDPVCSAQTAYEPVTITGEKFLGIGGDSGATPSVEIGEATPESVELRDCEPVDGNVPDGTRHCTILEADLPAGALSSEEDSETGTHPVRVTNPGAASCAGDGQVAVTSIDPPVVEAVGPQPVVNARLGDRLTISGERFALVDGERPEVRIGDEDDGPPPRTYTPVAMEDCREIKGPNERRVNLCSEIEIEIEEGDLPIEEDSAELPVRVANPAPLECDSRESAAEHASLTLIDAPTLSSVSPTPICTKDGAREVEVRGEDLLRVEGRTPMLAVGMQAYPTRVAEEVECEPLEHAGDLEVERCPGLVAEIAPSQLPAEHTVTVYNPEPVGGFTSEQGEAAELQVLERPRVDRVSPVLTCLAEGERTVEIVGEGFVGVDSEEGTPAAEMPTVTTGQVGAQASVESISECDDEPIAETSTETYRRCERLEVTLSGGEPGLAELTVTNPMPVGCASDERATVRVAPAPTVTSAAPSPNTTCDEENFRRIVVEGDDLLSDAGRLPEVQLGSQEPIEPRAADGCTEVSDSGERQLESCDALIVYPTTDELDQSRQLTVQNPGPSECSSEPVTVDPCP